MNRRPSPQQVAQALRDVALLWRPPDAEKDSAVRAETETAEETQIPSTNYTPQHVRRKVTP